MNASTIKITIDPSGNSSRVEFNAGNGDPSFINALAIELGNMVAGRLTTLVSKQAKKKEPQYIVLENGVKMEINDFISTQEETIQKLPEPVKIDTQDRVVQIMQELATCAAKMLKLNKELKKLTNR